MAVMPKSVMPGVVRARLCVAASARASDGCRARADSDVRVRTQYALNEGLSKLLPDTYSSLLNTHERPHNPSICRDAPEGERTQDALNEGPQQTPHIPMNTYQIPVYTSIYPSIRGSALKASSMDRLCRYAWVKFASAALPPLVVSVR